MFLENSFQTSPVVQWWRLYTYHSGAQVQPWFWELHPTHHVAKWKKEKEKSVSNDNSFFYYLLLSTKPFLPCLSPEDLFALLACSQNSFAIVPKTPTSFCICLPYPIPTKLYICQRGQRLIQFFSFSWVTKKRGNWILWIHELPGHLKEGRNVERLGEQSW